MYLRKTNRVGLRADVKLGVVSTIRANVKNTVLLLLLLLFSSTVLAADIDMIKIIHKYVIMYDLDVRLVDAIIQVESSGKVFAESNVGACGLMQVMPATFKEWSRKCKIKNPDIWNIDHNIHVGCAYLQWCIKHGGDERRGIIAYNRGLTRMRREQGKVDWYYKRVMKEKSKQLGDK